MSEKKQSKTQASKTAIKCRDAYIADGGSSVVDEYEWQWNAEERQMKPVKVGEVDMQLIVEQSAGSDLHAILNRQEGSTPAAKLANAVDNGLLNADVASVTQGTAWDIHENDEIHDLTGLPSDKLDAELTVKAAQAKAARMNKDLGLKGEDALDFEEYFKGKADAIVREYLESKIKASQPAEDKGE